MLGMFGDSLSGDYVRRVTTMNLVRITSPAQTLFTNSRDGEGTCENKSWRKKGSEGK